jgi:putative ABC transport system permease protein
VSAILRETGLLAVLGIVLGIGFSFAASWAIRHRFPLVQVVVTSDWVLRAMLVAVLGAIAGALYPAFKAAGKDPIEALAYE